MPRAKNILGQRFGKLVAMGSFKDEKNRLVWNMQCDCGNIRVCQYKSLSAGMVSCIDCSRHGGIAGKRFGRLLVVKRSGSAKNGSLWLCKCDCGNEKEITKANLNAGKHVSCGCRRKELLSGELRRGKFKEGAVWRTTEYYRDRKRKLRKTDPLFSMQIRLSANIRQAFSKNRIKKNGKTFDLLGYSVDDLCLHLEKCFMPGMTWENRKDWHIDHIIPISSAKTEEDLIMLNQLSNLRPIWAKENLKKYSKRTHLI